MDFLYWCNQIRFDHFLWLLLDCYVAMLPHHSHTFYYCCNHTKLDTHIHILHSHTSYMFFSILIIFIILPFCFLTRNFDNVRTAFSGAFDSVFDASSPPNLFLWTKPLMCASLLEPLTTTWRLSIQWLRLFPSFGTSGPTNQCFDHGFFFMISSSLTYIFSVIPASSLAWI